ncbi:MAG: cytochrome c oxidase assembly protein [Rickettsiaceae bacterium]|nr:cytochrome c oxidase assembly protein [Rickettsiaceae bacterium]
MVSKDVQGLVKSLIFLIIGMIFLSFASSPIYNVFCKTTGTGGTVSVSDRGSNKKGTKILVVRFDGNTEPGLRWNFYPKQKEVRIITGENNLVFYEAINLDEVPIVGTAVYNVTPQKAGKYFNKIECFCFQEQLLEPQKLVLMPVSFFIDAEFDNDPDMSDVNTITLSYSFFKIREIK